MLKELIMGQIEEYANHVIAPSHVVHLEWIDEYNHDGHDIRIWQLESDLGELYWAFDGSFAMDILRKSGVFNNMEQALAFYIERNTDLDDSLIC